MATKRAPGVTSRPTPLFYYTVPTVSRLFHFCECPIDGRVRLAHNGRNLTA